MGTRHPNVRLVKKHRSYTINEIALLFQLHRNTVRNWARQGLEPIDDRKPVVFHGTTLAVFLETRRANAKRPCPPGHIYCLPCRAAMEPAGEMVDYIPITAEIGNLRGICPACGRLIHRCVNRANLAAALGKMEVAVADAPLRIRETGDPAVNCEFGPEGSDDGD